MKSPSVLATLFLLALLILSSCAHPRKFKDFSFYDAAGNKYSTSSLSKDFANAYGMEISPSIILVITDSTKNPLYIEQINQLENVTYVEERSIVFVTSSVDDRYDSGYSIKKEDRRNIFNSNSRDFHTLLFSHDGKVLLDSKVPVTAKKIESIYKVEEITTNKDR